jgi:hypothetical protein
MPGTTVINARGRRDGRRDGLCMSSITHRQNNAVLTDRSNRLGKEVRRTCVR